MENLPKGDTPISIDVSGLMRLEGEPTWLRRPTKDGWYAMRYSYSSPLEVNRIVVCRNLGKKSDSFDLGFSIAHDAMGVIHRNKDQKEFWFAGPIDMNRALYAFNKRSDSQDSPAAEAISEGTSTGIQDTEGWIRSREQI